MHRIGIERLLSPASSWILRISGFQIRHQTLESMSGQFTQHPLGVPTPGRILWTAEWMSIKHWSRFLPRETFRVVRLQGDFKTQADFRSNLSMELTASEREDQLTVHERTGEPLHCHFLLRSEEGLMLGQIDVHLASIRQQARLSGAK